MTDDPSQPAPHPRPPLSPQPPPVPRTIDFRAAGGRLAALLFAPAGPAAGGLLICHGAGSCKENHGDLAGVAARHGLAALVFDFPGHGQSDGLLDSRAPVIVSAATATLRRHADVPWVAGRGSSMGAYFLLRAAIEEPGLFASVVALCPATEAAMLRHLEQLERARDAGDPDADLYGRFDFDDLRPFLATSSLRELARGLPRVLLAHALDDDVVPYADSVALLAVLAEPKRMITLERGGHTAAQHDPGVATATVEWALRHAPLETDPRPPAEV